MAELETGAAEQPAASVLDSLNAAFAEHETPVETVAATETPAVTETPVDTRARDPQGRFVKTASEIAAETAAPVATTETPAVADPAAAVPGIVPQHWSAEDKALVAKLPAELRSEYVERFKKMEGGFQPKLVRAAALEKDYGELDPIFKAEEANIAAAGYTKASLIKAWADTELSLRRDPEGTIRRIAQFYRVDLGKPATAAPVAAQPDPAAIPAVAGDEGYVDPALKSVQDELAKITQWVKRSAEAESRAATTRTMNEITAFAETKTEAGQPAHPHFNDVIADMLAMAQAERAAGRTPALKDLYDKAVWANPTTRAKQLAAQEAATIAAQDAQRRQAADAEKTKAAAARKAGSSVSGAPSGSAQAPRGGSKGSISADIAAAIEQHA